MKWSCVALILMTSSGAWAEGFFSEATTRVSAVYKEYSGERLNSLSTNGNAYGAEVISKKGNSFLGIVGGAGVSSVGGSEVFLDGTTEKTLTYSGYTFDLLLGFTFNLLPSKDLPMRPYFGAIGIGEMVSLSLPKGATYTTLKADNSLTTTGSALVGGVESTPKTKGAWGYNFEVRYSDIKGKIFGREKFQMGGLSFSLGLSF